MMPTSYRRSYLSICVGMMLCAAMACSIGGSGVSSTEAPTTTSIPANSPPPKVNIVSPSDGAQGVVNQPFTVQVHGNDGIGITRIEMHESGRIVVSQPLPEPDTNPSVDLVYRPTQVGNITLQVVAYRNSTGSDPVSITVQVVASAAQLSNPNSLDATSGLAAGAACAVKATVNYLNLRSGPGTTYPSVATLTLSEALNVIGRNADSSWFQVKRTSNNGIGWVSSTYTAPNDGCDKAAVVTPTPS